MKGSIRRPSPALIVSVIALVAALTGTAVGLPGKKNIDRNDLRKNVVALKHLRNGAVGIKELRANSVGNSESRLFKSSGLVKTSAAGSQAAAPRLTLLQRGPLVIYGKCFVDAANIRAEIYLRTTAPGALLDSDGDDEDGGGAEPLDGYVNPGEDEEQHEITTAVTGAAPDADGDSEQFSAVRGGTVLTGNAAAWAKNGALAAGDGPYGGGNRCIFHANYGGIG